MVHKTKAAMQGRQCEETKQDQHTRPGAGGQSLSDAGIHVAGNVLNNKQSAKLSFVAPKISGAGNCANGAHPLNNALGNCANGALTLQVCAVLLISPQRYANFTVPPWVFFELQICNTGYAVLRYTPCESFVGIHAHKSNFRQWRRCTAAPHTPREISPNFGRLIFNQGRYALSASLASLRWRRLISFSRAVTTNCPVLSPSLFSNSTDSATWCGTRTSNLFDLALMDLVAITQVLVIRCPTIIYEKKAMAILDVSDTYKYYVSDTLILLKCKNSEARQCWSTNRASDHKPLSEVTIMADLQHTQTHPKFTWRFLALSSIGCDVVHITANTEREAREQSPDGCVMVFAGRLPVREVRYEHA